MPNPQGIVQTDPMNKTQGRHVRSYSTFDESLSYRLANTLRFGDYTPSFVMDGVENDEIQLNSKDLIDSLSLKAPFKGSIRKIKESFKVPLMAILPMNWDRVYVQPSNGDDVPADANCVLLNFPKDFSDFFTNLVSVVGANLPTATSTDAQVAAWLTAFLRMLVVGEYIYSHGSLLNVLGYKGSAQFFSAATVNGTFDEVFDKCINEVFGQFKSLPLKIVTHPSDPGRMQEFYGLASGSSYNPSSVSSFRCLLEIFRENPLCSFDTSSLVHIIEYNTNISDFVTAVTALYSVYNGVLNVNNYKFILPNPVSSFDTTTDITSLNPNTLNLSRILAYQLVCAHFYTNSSIDVLYTAEHYRQYLHSFFDVGFTSATDIISKSVFSYNGISTPYDYLSGHCLKYNLYINGGNDAVYNLSYTQLSGNDYTDPSVYRVLRLASFAAIFAYRKSLRYGDYFVGSRPRPLAPINTDVAVSSGNTVSVIDITRGIQAQRFANSVMRSRQKIEEYVKSLFGKAPAPDYHNPFFLTRQAEVIFGDEVQNTADSQTQDANSRTANFASNMGQYTFTFHNDDEHPCIYLQIISFDVKRFYSRSVERQFLHVDRFDMFNPDFQFIGDQPIYGIELGYPDGGPLGTGKFVDNFSYTTRDMEYKQRFDQCAGGFVNDLPGWILTDRDRSRLPVAHLDPDFIRSYNTELDQFFLSLSGFALGSYFHFVCITNNFVNAKRNMAVDPQILG